MTNSHLKITDYVIELIRRNNMVSGQQIPSISQLADLFSVSQYTVRQAISRLENLGWIISVHGKGHFVSERPAMIRSTFSRTTRFTDTMVQAGERPTVKLLDWRLGEANPEEGETLKLAPGANVYRLEILRFAGTTPVTLSTSILPAALYPNLEEHFTDFRSLYTVINTHYRFIPIRKHTVIEARLPQSDEVELLQIQENVPILWTRSLNLHPNGTPAEITFSRLRGDRNQYVFEIED